MRKAAAIKDFLMADHSRAAPSPLSRRLAANKRLRSAESQDSCQLHPRGLCASPKQKHPSAQNKQAEIATLVQIPRMGFPLDRLNQKPSLK